MLPSAKTDQKRTPVSLSSRAVIRGAIARAQREYAKDSAASSRTAKGCDLSDNTSINALAARLPTFGIQPRARAAAWRRCGFESDKALINGRTAARSPRDSRVRPV